MTDPATVRARAAELLPNHVGAGSLVARSGSIAPPHFVAGVGGGRERWFVPVVVGDRLAGFFLLSDRLELLRWSSFARREDGVEDCPRAEIWLDPIVIGHRAAEFAGSEPSGVPVLGFEGSPDRLAWIVPFGARSVAVAGDAVWWHAPEGRREIT